MMHGGGAAGIVFARRRIGCELRQQHGGRAVGGAHGSGFSQRRWRAVVLQLRGAVRGGLAAARGPQRGGGREQYRSAAATRGPTASPSPFSLFLPLSRRWIKEESDDEQRIQKKGGDGGGWRRVHCTGFCCCFFSSYFLYSSVFFWPLICFDSVI